MLLRTALRDDALTSTDSGFQLRIGLPWIRSMPLSSVGGAKVTLDGQRTAITVLLGDRPVLPEALALEQGWWFAQDRLVIQGDLELTTGEHHVAVDFSLMMPYMQASPGVPLVLPFHLEGSRGLNVASGPTVSRDVA